MKSYIAILNARFKTLIQYRAAAFAGFVTQMFWGLIRIMILAAFYESGSETQPISFASVVPYIWLGQAFLGLLPWNVDKDVQEMVRTGSVAYELLRPLDMYRLWFVRSLAWRTATALLRAVPLVLFAAVVIRLVGLEEWALELPPTLIQAGCFFLTMIGAAFLSCAITTLFNITLLWTVSGTGVAHF